ncbi:MAG: transcriptional regulator, GntR family [Ilumatobacteraceae bacterium]|nr:transcriptional regulator, GntR family [Ilumatobacteraceae bacterium]
MPPTVARSARHAPRPGESIADAVARLVRAQIFEGQLVAGQRLPQDDIAASVGVSRIPVREAIITLEREGWVRVERHRGAFVTVFDEQAVLDRFALYGRLYGFAAVRALQRMTPDDLRTLQRSAQTLARVAGPKAFERANNEYMSTFVSLSGSSRLRAVLRSTAQIVPGNFFATVPKSVGIQRNGVGRLQHAFDTGDASGAEQIWRAIEDEHALAVIDVMHARRRSRGA